jgi:hypothetical protein
VDGIRVPEQSKRRSSGLQGLPSVPDAPIVSLHASVLMQPFGIFSAGFDHNSPQDKQTTRSKKQNGKEKDEHSFKFTTRPTTRNQNNHKKQT